MGAYSEDLRERVLRALERGDGCAETAERFEVSRAWVYDVKRRFEEHGERSARRQGGYRLSRLERFRDVIEKWLAEQPGLTLAEMAERLREEKKVGIGVNALWWRLSKWGLTYKKNSLRQRAREGGCEGKAGRVESKAVGGVLQEARVP
jgi:transposase